MELPTPSDEDLQVAIHDAKGLLAQSQTLLIATQDASNHPHISYAPYVCAAHQTEPTQSAFFIFISQLAKHHQTLLLGTATIMLIADEANSPNIFARKRLTLDCRVRAIDPQSDHAQVVLDQLAARHGNTVKLLRSLSDFTLFQLHPQNAWFVGGFGAALDLSVKLPELLQSRV